jgi:A/G-specific adenine glycosylase
METLASWFDTNKRDLPWRGQGATPWAVLVSEVMLQQTPVARVIPHFEAWLKRWPTPSDLANDSVSEAIKAWARLGYPRRAKALYDAATVIHTVHGGEVPKDLDALLALPGVGDYTARAILCFAFGMKQPVVDTNVRRVIARAMLGQGEAGPPRTTHDRKNVEEALAAVSDDATACLAVAGLMELGAVVCMAKTTLCDQCPLSAACAWRNAGYPVYGGPQGPKQARYEGSDRQVRGIILRELRNSDTAIPGVFLATLWSEPAQFERALRSLIADGLVVNSPEQRDAYELPSG